METADTGARKSSSLDNVNLQQENKAQWKSFSLQRGAVPPTEEEAGHTDQVIAMKSRAEPVAGSVAGEQEDMYGRCTNMRLTSFSDKGAAVPRDPRLIDLSQSAASTGNLGHPPQLQHNPSPFNTLPAHISQHQAHQPLPQPQPHHPHNTLPARVNFPPNHLPSGRHFKPFDHRRINPMAEIQENPYEQQANGYGGQYGPENGHETYIVHHNNHIPHMPQELRHTNYGPTTKQGLVHPQVLQHRDNGH